MIMHFININPQHSQRYNWIADYKWISSDFNENQPKEGRKIFYFFHLLVGTKIISTYINSIYKAVLHRERSAYEKKKQQQQQT